MHGNIFPTGHLVWVLQVLQGQFYLVVGFGSLRCLLKPSATSSKPFLAWCPILLALRLPLCPEIENLKAFDLETQSRIQTAIANRQLVLKLEAIAVYDVFSRQEGANCVDSIERVEGNDEW